MSISLKYYNDQYPVGRQRPNLQFVSICHLCKPSFFTILSLIVLYYIRSSFSTNIVSHYIVCTANNNVKAWKYDTKIREKHYKRYKKQSIHSMVDMAFIKTILQVVNVQKNKKINIVFYIVIVFIISCVKIYFSRFWKYHVCCKMK